MASLEDVATQLGKLRKQGKHNYGDGTVIIKPGRRSLYGRVWVDGTARDVCLGIDPANYQRASQAVSAAIQELRRLRYNDTEREKLQAKQFDAPLTVNGILDAYFENLERRSRTGQRIERKSISDAHGFADRHVRPHIGDRIAEHITKNCIEQLRDAIARTPKERGGGQRSLSGIQAPLRILRAAYRFALECEPPLITRMPKIHTVSETHRARHGYFPEQDIHLILPYFDASTRVAIAVALDSGLRSIKELLYRRWEDIDWVNSTMAVPGDSTKNDEARIVPIRPGTMLMLAESKRLRDERFPNCPWVFFWKERRGRGEPGQRMAGVYQQFKQAMGRAAKALKRPELAQRVPHDCRRSFVTNQALDGGLTDVEVAKMSGHKDLSVFGRYKVPGRDAAQIAANVYKSQSIDLLKAATPGKPK